ncbi:unnamed protein product [Penicillium salamii]|uniref:Uncharacterized protein n=1 Tax=Penicillium salamii TaxID=1612424 RepID=A0A9W4I6I8_9EURO|nr:unnamed protein product [Penicillium salamii]
MLNLSTHELKSIYMLPLSQTHSTASFFLTLVSRMHLTATCEILVAANNCSNPHQSFASMQEFFLQEYYTTSI